MALEQAHQQNYYISWSAFQPRVPTNYFCNVTTAYYSSGSGASSYTTASVIIPTGSRITAINFVYYDNDPNDDLQFIFYKSCGNSVGSTQLLSHVVNSTAGAIARNYQLTLSEVVGNNCQYYILAKANQPGTTTSDWSPQIYVVKAYVQYVEN